MTLQSKNLCFWALLVEEKYLQHNNRKIIITVNVAMATAIQYCCVFFFPFFFFLLLIRWRNNVRVFKVHDWHLFHLLLPPDKRLYRLPRCFIISKSPLPSIDAASNKSYIVNCSVKLFFGALFLTFLVQFWHFSAVSTELPAWLMGTPAYKMMNFTYLEVGMDVY